MTQILKNTVQNPRAEHNITGNEHMLENIGQRFRTSQKDSAPLIQVFKLPWSYVRVINVYIYLFIYKDLHYMMN